MLLEKTTYLDDFPISIRMGKVTEYPIHYHLDVDFIYVLKGEVRLKNVCHHYLLKEGDVFTNSGHEIHGLTATDKDNVVAIVQVSNRFFTKYFPALTKACFMTYTKNDKHLRLDTLQKMLLQILLDYSRKSFHYKNTCIDHMIDAIKYLNQHYNLFAFEGQVVVNFNNDNPVIVERISRITNYIYANHASKISLEELAESEHLSTFYISHLIRDYIGLNFKEFLCFARVEMSEIILLETDRKISVIARDVGFSTTAYYEKFFKKWFGHSPQEYRQLYTPQILSAARPPRLELLPANQAIHLIKQRLSAVRDQEKSASVIHGTQLTVDVKEKMPPILDLQHTLEVVITHEDWDVMGQRLFTFLSELNASGVILAMRPEDSDATTAQIADHLRSAGYEVSIACDNGLCGGSSAGYDSIAAGIQLFRTRLASREKTLHCRLRDQGEPSRILKGAPSCLTSCLVPKPSFYAYKLLQKIKGTVISLENHYAVIKNDLAGRGAYTLVSINYREDIQHLPSRNAGVYETNDLLRAFQDELHIDFNLPVEAGHYAIAKYELTNANSIFAHMSQLGFPEVFPLAEGWIRMLNTQPQAQVSLEHVDGMLNVSSGIKGAGIHVIVVEKVSQTD